MLIYTHIRSLGSCNHIPWSQAALLLFDLMIYSSLGFPWGARCPWSHWMLSAKSRIFLSTWNEFVDQKLANGNVSSKGELLQVKQRFLQPKESSWMFPDKFNTIWGFGKKKNRQNFDQDFLPACQLPLIIQAAMGKAQQVHPFFLAVPSRN